MIKLIFSVGPSGVCWAVDKKETVPSYPLDIRNIKKDIKKGTLWFCPQRFGVGLEQRTQASLAPSGSPSLAGVSHVNTFYFVCLVDHFPHTDYGDNTAGFQACIHFCWAGRGVGHLTKE